MVKSLRRYAGRNATLTIGEEDSMDLQGHLEVFDWKGNPARRPYIGGLRIQQFTYKFITEDGQRIPVGSRGQNRVRVLSRKEGNLRFHAPNYTSREG